MDFTPRRDLGGMRARLGGRWKGGVKHRPNLIYFSVIPVIRVVPDILVEEISVALGPDKPVYYFLGNRGIAVLSSVIQSQMQLLGFWVVGSPVNLLRMVNGQGLVHYPLTFFSLLFFALAAGLALRVALARIAPADFALYPSP